MASSEHFSDDELQCQGTECGPEFIGCHIIGTTQALVDALEAFRAAVGKPVIINSGYRCPVHNAAVGGAPNSQHMLGEAADIRVTGMTAGQLEAYARTIPAIKGIGRADHAQYLHIDVRSSPTVIAWTYGMDGRTEPYYPSSDAVISA